MDEFESSDCRYQLKPDLVLFYLFLVECGLIHQMPLYITQLSL